MVIGIQHLQTSISLPAAPKMHFQKAQTIQLVKKLTCVEGALKGPLFTLKTGWILPQRHDIKGGHGSTKNLRIS